MGNVCHSTKTLGMIWAVERDIFRFDSTGLKRSDIISKRSILSTIACLYDPLGLLGPVLLWAKLLYKFIPARSPHMGGWTEIHKILPFPSFRQC